LNGRILKERVTIELTAIEASISFEHHIIKIDFFVKRILLEVGIAVVGRGPEVGSTVVGRGPEVGIAVVGRAREVGSAVVGRGAKLQEDTNLGDEDEILCRITISPLYLPAEVTAWTNQEILLG